MAGAENSVFACGESFFRSLFLQAGCITADSSADNSEIIKKMKEENPGVFIFSQKAFEKIKKDFKENFEDRPYIVFPFPGEENLIEKEIAELVKIAVGVEL